MKVDYNDRQFRAVETTENGQVGDQTLFRYAQHGAIVTGTYSGGDVAQGHLIATVDAEGGLDMRYHHVSRAGALMTGKCRSKLEVLPDGRYRLHEQWQWTSGDGSSGTSIVEEVRD